MLQLISQIAAQNILLVLISYLVSVEENVHFFFVTAMHKLCVGVPSSSSDAIGSAS